MGIICCAAGNNQGVRCWYLLFGQTTSPSSSVANGDSLPFVGPQPYRWLL